MSQKTFVLTLLTFLMLIPFVAGFNATTSTYVIEAFHTGIATRNVSTTSTYEFESTSTVQQPSANGTSVSYSFFLTWFPQQIKYDAVGPTITLHSPPDNTIVYIPKITINFTASDDTLVSNCTLFIDNVTAYVNTSIPSTSILITGNLTEGRHSWHIGCIDSLNQPKNTSRRYVSADFSVSEVADSDNGGGGGSSIAPQPDENEEDEISEEELAIIPEIEWDDETDVGNLLGVPSENLIEEIIDEDEIFKIITSDQDIDVVLDPILHTVNVKITGPNLYGININQKRGEVPRFDIDISGKVVEPIEPVFNVRTKLFNFIVGSYRTFGDKWDWLLLFLVFLATTMFIIDKLKADRKEKIWQSYKNWRQRK